jgi:hypothetical protein
VDRHAGLLSVTEIADKRWLWIVLALLSIIPKECAAAAIVFPLKCHFGLLLLAQNNRHRRRAEEAPGQFR